MKLYKYRSFNDNSVTNLENSNLWFSRIIDFNDPFEGKFRPRLTYQPDKRRDAKALYYKLFCRMKKVGLPQNDIDYIKGLPTLELKLRAILYFLSKAFTVVYEDALNNDGYCCFSKGDDLVVFNQLMWSHYADGLRGYCLVFDEEKLLSSILCNDEMHLTPIIYTDEFLELDILEQIKDYLDPDHSSNSDFSIRRISTKSMVWQYESEWRAISPAQGIHTYSADSLVEVILGEKMPEPNKELIKSIVSNTNKHTNISEMVIESDRYRLSKREVSPK